MLCIYVLFRQKLGVKVRFNLLKVLASPCPDRKDVAEKILKVCRYRSYNTIKKDRYIYFQSFFCSRKYVTIHYKLQPFLRCKRSTMCSSVVAFRLAPLWRPMAREGWQNTDNFQKNKTLCNTKIQQFILKDAGLSVHQAKAAVTEAEQCIKVATVCPIFLARSVHKIYNSWSGNGFETCSINE